MRPPAPWSLTSLRTLKARSARPLVAATPAVMKETPSAPIVRPPRAVASRGDALEHQRRHVDHDLGRQDRLLGVDEPARRPPRLEHEVAAAHRVLQEVLADPLARVAHVRTTAPVPARTSPTIDAPTPRARQGERRPGRHSGPAPRPCPRPQLKTRTISSARDGAATLDLEEDLGRLEAREVDHRVERVAGRIRCTLPTMPPPVTWAAACTPPPRASISADDRRRVDHRRAQELVGRGSSSRPPTPAPSSDASSPTRTRRARE